MLKWRGESEICERKMMGEANRKRKIRRDKYIYIGGMRTIYLNS